MSDEKLDVKLREWKPNTVAEVKEQVGEIIDLTIGVNLGIFDSVLGITDINMLKKHPSKNPL